MNSRDFIAKINEALERFGPRRRAFFKVELPARFGGKTTVLAFGKAKIVGEIVERKQSLVGGPITVLRIWCDDAIAELERGGLLTREEPPVKTLAEIDAPVCPKCSAQGIRSPDGEGWCDACHESFDGTAA